MQSAGVKIVSSTSAPYQNAVRLAAGDGPAELQADLRASTRTVYDPAYVQLGRLRGQRTYSSSPDRSRSRTAEEPAAALYEQWLQRTAPGAAPTFFGVYAWAAAALFTQLAQQLGGKLNRATLLAAMRNIHNYTGNGLFAPQRRRAARTPATACRSSQLKSGKWVRISPSPYTCDSVINSVWAGSR